MLPNTLSQRCNLNTLNLSTVYDHDIRQRVIKQLLEALLFENIIDYTYSENRFDFSVNGFPCYAHGYVGGFGRIRLDANSIMMTASASAEGDTLLALDTIMDSLPCDDNRKHAFHNELRQTIRLCQWNLRHSDQLTSSVPSRRMQDYHELESSIDEGHPYHPSFKARTGFSEQDHAAYGPETAQPFQLHWLAIRRRYLHHSLPEEGTTKGDLAFWRHEIGSDALAELETQLTHQGWDWHQFGLLPIHPWQWQHYRDTSLAEAIDGGDIVYLGVAGDHYHASISVRTLLNASHPEKAHIKLPLNMVNTSSIRSLDPHAVLSAPTISRWLSLVMKDDPYFTYQAPMQLLEEYAGITVCPPLNTSPNTPPDSSLDSPLDTPQWLTDLQGQLAVIFRQSIPQDQITQAVPFSALAVMEKDGMPFIHPWIARYSIEKWTAQLIRVAILPVWHLLVHHGIGIEAHGQNIILIHNEGWPERIVLRDFHDSVEYVKTYLADPTLEPNFEAIHPTYQGAPDNQYYWMASEEALRELVIDTLFVFNLSEIAYLLEREYHYPESSLWADVSTQLSLYAQSDTTSQDRIDKVNPFSPMIQTESLLTLKLKPTQNTIISHDIPNALAPLPPNS